MPQVCRIDIGRGQALYTELEEKLRILGDRIRERYPNSRIIVFGSFVRHELHEGSDIDLVVVGDIPGRFHERGTFIRDLTDLPVEALCYTPGEFDEMVRRENILIRTVLEEGRDL
jgi:predicted nucleotidyltransferase